jgi:hypothetical protein
MMDVGLQKALEMLSGCCEAQRKIIENGHSVPWFGSGISREKFPDVGSLIFHLIELLHARIDSANPNCPFLGAVRDIISLVSGDFIDLIHTLPSTWKEVRRKALLKELTDKYASVLQVAINTGGIILYVRWDVLDLIQVYSDPSIEPDAEHFFIALLLRERIWEQCVTTNWDPLIERAYEKITVAGSTLASIACPSDFVDTFGREIVLFKIHGCALKASVDKSKYQKHMVATETELGQWSRSELANAFREVLGTMLRSKAIMFVGLSGQDFNLKEQIIATTQSTNYSVGKPRVCFTTSSLNSHHKTILNAFYGEKVFAHNQAEIEADASIPLYGKPFLGGLWVDQLFRKLEIVTTKSDLRLDSKSTILRALKELKNSLCDKFNLMSGGEVTEGWRWLANSLPKFITNIGELFREQQIASGDAYKPILPRTLADLENDHNLSLLKFDRIVWGISLFAEGNARGAWSLNLDLVNGGSIQPIVISNHLGNRTVIFCADSANAVTRCFNNNVIDDTNAKQTRILYASTKPQSRTRSPSSVFRIRGSRMDDPKEIWLESIYYDSGNDDEALELLRLEVA